MKRLCLSTLSTRRHSPKAMYHPWKKRQILSSGESSSSQFWLSSTSFIQRSTWRTSSQDILSQTSASERWNQTSSRTRWAPSKMGIVSWRRSQRYDSSTTSSSLSSKKRSKFQCLLPNWRVLLAKRCRPTQPKGPISLGPSLARLWTKRTSSKSTSTKASQLTPISGTSTKRSSTCSARMQCQWTFLWTASAIMFYRSVSKS